MLTEESQHFLIIVIAGVHLIQFIYESDRELFENAIGFAQLQVKRLIENSSGFLSDVQRGREMEA